PRPQPRDHRQLLADVLLQVRPLLGHRLGNLDFGIEMPDAFLALVAHPLAVVADVLGQALGAAPDLGRLLLGRLLLPVRVARQQARSARAWLMPRGLFECCPCTGPSMRVSSSARLRAARASSGPPSGLQ